VGVSVLEARESMVMNAQKIDRVIARLARQIQEPEDAQDGVVLIGIRRGGEALTQRLATKMGEVAGVKPAVGFLNVTLYRDDDVAHALPDSDIFDDLNDKVVVIVDDVLYTGRTVRSALDAITDLGRPRVIRLAVLVDRGLRELPIRGDYIGRTIPTSPHERIEVHLSKEYDDTDRIVLLDADRDADRVYEGTTEI
jgi:pyrimidine operon attenuation protein/uracil phosphoribosyltransferase